MEILKPEYVWAYRPGLRANTDFIVLHHAAANGAPEDVHRYHRDVKGWAGIAYHYYIRKDGRVYQGREDNWNGGHTEGYNSRSIGVCFEGNFDAERMSPEQLAAGRELLAVLQARYPEAVIVRHGDLSATVCPGGLFPFAALTEQLPVPAPEENAEQPAPWAAEAVGRWISLGILQGDGSGRYGFAEPVTLERMITLVERRLAANSAAE